jgi:hypothetical protein
LLSAYSRIYGDDGDDKIESSLSKLTGLTLPEGTPPAKWKRNWNLKTDRGPTIAKAANEPREM